VLKLGASAQKAIHPINPHVAPTDCELNILAFELSNYGLSKETLDILSSSNIKRLKLSNHNITNWLQINSLEELRGAFHFETDEPEHILQRNPNLKFWDISMISNYGALRLGKRFFEEF
jgi:hypothetical protein